MTEEVSFKTRDDILLWGKEFKGEDPHSLLLLFLGLGGNAQSKSVDYFGSALAKKGITTIVFSARGHGKSRGLFSFQKHIDDIQELEEQYSLHARKHHLSFTVAGHSISGRALVCADVKSDVILLNPTLFRGHPRFVTLPVIRRFYLLWWNLFVFKKVSFTHFGNVYFNSLMFKRLIEQTTHQEFPTSKQEGRCLLLITSKDVVARYNDIPVRDKVKALIKKRYSASYDVLFLGLDHEFSDGSRTFMRTDQLPKILNAINMFTRSAKK
ncbi:MAG: alpha/beta hydrolase [Nanoarchaeota archaeon]|nr:alpha/beta hydrolase [Nanoarchaeota archaeon]